MTPCSILASMLLAAPAVHHDDWQAQIELPGPAPAYRLLLDDELTAALGQQGASRADIVDAEGRTMPRGSMQQLIPRDGGSVSHESTLTLSNTSERNVRPPSCDQGPRPDDCSIFEPAPSRLPRGVGQMSVGAVASGRSAGGALGGATLSSRPANDIGHVPLAFSVVTAQLPSETLEWSKPTLVLQWTSTLAPDAITWQIGRNVATVTEADRNALAGRDGGTSMAALQRVWWRNGRFDKFGRLKATSNGAGEWEAEVPLNWNDAAQTLEIGSAPTGAVHALSTRVKGDVHEIVDGETSPDRALALTARAPGIWHIEDPWPRTTMEVVIAIDAKQALMATDAGIDRLQFVLRSESGAEKPFWLSPSMRSTYTFYDPKQNWTELQLLTPPNDFGAPKLSARYSVAMLWFENRGTPPYVVRAGALSQRRSDEASASSAASLYGSPGTKSAAPLARVMDVRKVGTSADPPSPQELRKSDNGRATLLIAAIAVLLVTLLAAADLTLRRRLDELENRR
ncbi:MAG TPA: hypothetical protein VGO25_05740 [Rhodanobacteraceae bacterium]|nr:hypothetical protein [Rhodanobacteraceae bacterium]